jgi:phage recombination protein Bet
MDGHTATACGKGKAVKQQHDLELLRRTEFASLTDDEFQFFLAFCEEKGVNPWLRHIKPKPFYNPTHGRNELQMITTIQALRIIALETGKHQGVTGPHWRGKNDEAWVDCWTKTEPPFAAQAGVHRKGFKHPTIGTVLWDSYCQFEETRDGKRVPTEFWLRMGAFMLGKCAEAQALRAAFPERLAGLFMEEELRGSPATPRESSPTPEGSERGWDPVSPQTPFQFHLTLSEMGLQDPKRREQIIRAFRESHPHVTDAAFYKLVVEGIRANPQAFGVELEAVMA